jgi:argininosuccinate lyase
VDCLLVLEGTIAGAEPREAACAQAVADPLLLATDLVDYLVLKGLPFRKAHHVVGGLVALSEKKGCPLDQLPLDEARTISGLLEADWVDCFSVERALAMREKTGMPGPGRIKKELTRWRKLLS